jgi:hypothetical protein
MVVRIGSALQKIKTRHIVAIVIGGLTLIAQVTQETFFVDVIIAVGINVAIVYGIAAIIGAIRNR